VQERKFGGQFPSRGKRRAAAAAEDSRWGEENGERGIERVAVVERGRRRRMRMLGKGAGDSVILLMPSS
jgi:hypothetical protein